MSHGYEYLNLNFSYNSAANIKKYQNFDISDLKRIIYQPIYN